MKIRQGSDKSFDEIKEISDGMYSGERDHFAKDMLEVLFKYENKLRSKDHKLKSVNFSIPTSPPDAFVIGLRYMKLDETYTEDHFLIEKNINMRACSKNELEKMLPEYKGAHKDQPRFMEEGIGSPGQGEMFSPVD